MRLIDLDKAVTVYDEDNNAVIYANIKNAEVKAIPVEWFEKRMKEINEAMTRLYVEGCYYPKSDDYEKRKNILLRRLAEIKLHGSAYDLVLNEWRVEKENEG